MGRPRPIESTFEAAVSSRVRGARRSRAAALQISRMEAPGRAISAVDRRAIGGRGLERSLGGRWPPAQVQAQAAGLQSIRAAGARAAQAIVTRSAPGWPGPNEAH